MKKNSKPDLPTERSEKERRILIEERSESIGDEHLSSRPGKEHAMETDPVFDDTFPGANRLKGKVALITGGDSGIGRAVAVGYAKEGAKVAITYLNETQDAKDTQAYIEAMGAEVLLIKGDVGHPGNCASAVKKTVEAFGKLDILVNNAAEQHPEESIENIKPEQLEKTFRTNIFGMFYMVQAALPHLREGSCIINTSSITGYEGNSALLDYASAKGAITAFTRSLAVNLAPRKIRVNQVAPGPIWTPLIPSTFTEDHVEEFGKNTLMQRAGQPVELTESYIFLAWDRASSYITGQTLHLNGGRFRSS